MGSKVMWMLMLAALLVIGGCSRETRTPSQLCKGCNVILISIDTLRADRLGSYGYYRNLTPNIDSLAARGVLFENAYSQSSTTTPSHMSIFTSRYPSEHRVCNAGPYSEDDSQCIKPLGNEIITLTEVLRAQGYYTRAFTGGGNVHSSFGFGRGFYGYDHLSMETFIDSEDDFAQFLEYLRREIPVAAAVVAAAERPLGRG